MTIAFAIGSGQALLPTVPQIVCVKVACGFCSAPFDLGLLFQLDISTIDDDYAD